MVIKFTINNLDYDYFLKQFIKELFTYMSASQKFISLTKYTEMEAAYNRFSKLTSAHNKEKLTQNEVDFILDYIKSRFIDYVEKHIYNETKQKLLIKNFNVKMQKAFVDRCENGESFYWLQHSGSIIIQ